VTACLIVAGAVLSAGAPAAGSGAALDLRYGKRAGAVLGWVAVRRRRTQIRRTQVTGNVVLVGASLLSATCADAPERAALHARSSSTPATQYLRIAQAANRRLEIDFDRLAGPDRDRLAGAVADLREAASTERMFDRDLLGLSLPPVVRVSARDLVWVNESRAKLTLTLSAYRSIGQLRTDEKRLATANRAVEEEVRSVRHQLGPPPPDTSDPNSVAGEGTGSSPHRRQRLIGTSVRPRQECPRAQPELRSLAKTCP